MSDDQAYRPMQSHAEEIAHVLATVRVEDRAELFSLIARELLQRHQGYTASLFNLLYALDKKSIDPLKLLVAAMRGADRA